ncbi:MAG: aminoacyl-tRNA hydrolase [Clostridia bacterium]|nr:aminoacyl-tRNA hydrolase [Clostridia bacterium]
MLFSSGSVEFLIVGLGNPGSEYDLTRHNVGFRALDFLAGACNTEVRRLKHMALTGKGTLGGHSVLFMKPQTYMNRSGQAVQDAARFYKIPAERVMVISDDISLPVGAMRIRYSGSAGGHNGLKSIQEHLSSDAYARIKLGVGGKAHAEMDLADHVLGKVSSSEFAEISENFPALLAALELIVKGDKEKAMSRYNRNPQKKSPQ